LFLLLAKMPKNQTLVTQKVTTEISASVLYPWEIGNYFKHNGQKYRIEKILKEVKLARIDGIVSEVEIDTPIENQIITSLVVGTLIR
jgi:hypothetical protein